LNKEKRIEDPMLLLEELLDDAVSDPEAAKLVGEGTTNRLCRTELLNDEVIATQQAML